MDRIYEKKENFSEILKMRLSFCLSYIKIGKDMKRTREGVISLSELKYKRILLKVSGEALGEKTAQGDGFGLDFKKIGQVASAIKECVDMGVQVHNSQLTTHNNKPLFALMVQKILWA